MKTRTSAQTESARAFFDTPERYLKRPVGLQLRIQIAHQMLNKLDHSTMLDVGCGSGAVSLTFLSDTNKLTLLDISSKMLEIARSQTPPEFAQRVTFVNSDIHEFPNPELYDVVLCFGVLAHVADPASTIERLADLTKPGGVCILQLTDQASPIAKINAGFHALREKTKPLYGYYLTPMRFNKIVKLAQMNDFQVEARYRYSVALPGMGRLPISIFRRIQELSMSLSVGSEVVLKLRKTA